MENKILLNDILKFDNLDNVKVRLNKYYEDDQKLPIHYFLNNSPNSVHHIIKAHYWNRSKKNFVVNDITIGFFKIPEMDDCWLLFHIGKVVKDLNVLNDCSYEAEDLHEYDKYIGRLIIKYKNTSRNFVRKAKNFLNECEVVQILPDKYVSENFPGYTNVNISWSNLTNLIEKDSWKTALLNQKGIYLLTDRNSGKKYVGSAYGEKMLYSRWKTYLETVHGNNKKLKKLDPEYIKKYFHFSILETFNNNISNQEIIQRENYWKTILMTRGEFGYNDN